MTTLVRHLNREERRKLLNAMDTIHRLLTKRAR
jgi:hypothetical protein